MSEPPATTRDEGEAGATLVELLVAMALMSLVALIATQGVRSVQGMMPVAARMDGAGESAAVRAHLSRTIGEAVSTLAIDVPAPFEGRPNGMRFVAPSDPILEVGGLADIRLGVEADKGEGQGQGQGEGSLDLVERRAVARDDRDEQGTTTVLLSGIASLTLSYGTRDGTWTPDWPEGAGLPALIRIEIAFPEGDRRRFRRLLVHPAASSPSGP